MPVTKPDNNGDSSSVSQTSNAAIAKRSIVEAGSERYAKYSKFSWQSLIETKSVEAGMGQIDRHVTWYPLIPAHHLDGRTYRLPMVRQHPLGSEFRVGSKTNSPRRDFAEGGWIVYLTERFRDHHLTHLADLHGVKQLCLAQSPITDAGLEKIANLPDLSWLALAETEVTDEGLAHLAGHRRLGRLHLAGKPGGIEFHDAGLKHLETLPKLWSLTLCGPGFTDEAVTGLKRCRSLRSLTLSNTEITEAGMRDLRKMRQLELKVYAY